jgi:serine/threonine-protein kinase
MNVLGNYTLKKSLGKGGMGEVFLAEDSICQRCVALKKIREELQKFPSIRSRFLREARIAAQLSHPSIISIFTISDEPGSSYYTMPYVEGLTLKEILKEGRGSEQKGSIPHLTRIFLAICQAIAYAHSKKILHRDLKPENVIVGKFGEVMILDWGLAQVAGEGDDLYPNRAQTWNLDRAKAPGIEIVGEGGSIEGIQPPSPTTQSRELSHRTKSKFEPDWGIEEIPSDKNNSHLTRPGKVVGTLAYLAPERVDGKAATEQTDLYALGVILFQILTLKMPFKRGDLETFQKRWKHEQIPDPIETAPDRDIPHALSQMALRALSPDPKQRYASVQQMITDLESFIEGKPDWIAIHVLDIDKREDWEFQELIMLARHMAISRLTEMEWVNLMISKGSFPGNSRLETTVKLHEDSRGIGFLVGAADPTDRKDLMDGFCLWIGAVSSPGCQLFRNNIDVLNIPSVSLEPGRSYEIRIEKNDHHLKLYIDGHLRLHYLSQTPLLGSQVGILRRDDNLEMSQIKMSIGSQNVMVSCLTLPDALLTYKEYDKALAEYRKIAVSFPGRMEGREALYRAGTTLIQAGRLDEALEEFGKLHGTAGAPLEYLGKSIVYQALEEWEEEAKCLELAVRKYSKHPLFRRLVEHIVFRLHESSSHHRLAAYHLALLALRHLPQIFDNPDNQQILEEIQKQWETLPYFPPNATAVQLAFLLARPLTLMEIIDSGQWVEESYFGLLELGCYELARESSHLEKYPAVQAAIHAAESGPSADSLESPRLATYLFYLHFDRGNLSDLAPSDTALKITALIANRNFEQAGALFDQIPIEQLTQENSPLFTLFGCYLWALEGEEIARAHFSAVEDMPHPPAALLLPYFIMGKIDLTGNWYKEAFYWEKLSLIRQLLLLGYALDDPKECRLRQDEIKKLRL